MTRWVINVLATLPFFAFGRVVVLGDAVCFSPTIQMTRLTTGSERIQAHAMTPFQGAGAGQAMEVSPRPSLASDLLIVETILFTSGRLDPCRVALTPARDAGHRGASASNLFPHPPAPRY
jgi:hypothetical protein